MEQLSIWQSLCESIDCKAAFTNLSAGVPTLIALFLIIYAHRVLSTRLKEATEEKGPENAALYRQQLGRVWNVAMFLLVVHAGLFIYTTTKSQHRMISGVIVDLDSGSDIGILAGGSIYKRRSIDNNLEWVVTEAAERIKLRISNPSFLPIDCEIKVAAGINPKRSLQAVFDTTQRPRRLTGLTHTIAAADQMITCTKEPRTKPGILNDLGAATITTPSKQTSQYFGLVGAAWAQSASQPVELDVLLKAINSDSYELRSDARSMLASNFSNYTGWAQSIATGATQPTANEIGALTWAVSRQNPEPWKDLGRAPNLTSEVVDYTVRQLLSDSEYVRENAKRFVISYPNSDMEVIIDTTLTPRTALEKERFAISKAHFLYNQGVFIAMANRAGIKTEQSYSTAQDRFNSAADIAKTLPADRQGEFARIDFAMGWAKALESKTAENPSVLLGDASEDIKRFLNNAKPIEDTYQYPWQIGIAESFLETKNPIAFEN